VRASSVAFFESSGKAEMMACFKMLLTISTSVVYQFLSLWPFTHNSKKHIEQALKNQLNC
jgi:hypothetical protein